MGFDNCAAIRAFLFWQFCVSPSDPMAFVSALAVMTITSAAACFLPAWRAMRTDPAKVLRD